MTHKNFFSSPLEMKGGELSLTQVKVLSAKPSSPEFSGFSH